MATPSRMLLVFAIALLLPGLAGAGRTAPTNQVKVGPKISTVTQSNNAAALAAQLVGPGVTIANAKFTGAAEAAGTFAGGAASVGVDTGVVLSTGHVVNVRGPNESDSWSDINGTPGDPRLDALVAPEVTFDAAILEFDVIPVANTVALRFVFASEEYNEFVGSPYNDVLAIFVNGVNCANYNGRPVSVNSINNDVNKALYIDNETGTRNTEMDGLTVPLDCVAVVTPNAANHVVIAIADTADSIYDAAVFLSAGGIRSPGSGPPTNSSVIKAFEFYHKVFNHYFVTANPTEIILLDNGTFVGWVRTGKAFNVFVLGTAGTLDVCRFFSVIPGALISTHFYTANGPECAGLKTNKNWVFEDNVFGILPATAVCPAGTQALYRAYNNSVGGVPNHRFVVDIADLQLMQSLGWTREGDYGIAGCVPL
ncbi:MAG: choice-of-anchor L domain-containing protein [Burkholderiales bacterium]